MRTFLSRFVAWIYAKDLNSQEFVEIVDPQLALVQDLQGFLGISGPYHLEAQHSFQDHFSCIIGLVGTFYIGNHGFYETK